MTISRMGKVRGKVLMLCLCVLSPTTAAAAYQLFTQAQFHHGDAQSHELQPAQSMSLPDAWRSDGRDQISLIGWYRFDVGRLDRSNPQAVFVPKFTQNIEVYVNHQLIGQSNPTDAHVVNWNRPFMFPIPDAVLQDQDNQIAIRLETDPNWGMMGPMAVGDAATLQPIYERHLFFQITVNQLAAGLSVFLGLISLAYWVSDRKQATYAWFTLGAVCWLYYSLNAFLTAYPFGSALWPFGLHVSADLFGVFYAVFCHRYLGLRRRRIEQLLGLYILAASCSYFYTYFFSTPPITWVFHMFALIIGLYSVGTVGYECVKRFDGRKLVLMISIGLTTALFIHDNLFARLQLDESTLAPFYAANLGVPLLMSFLLLSMTRDFLLALRQAERANDTLEERVGLYAEQLETSYQERSDIEQRQAALVERNRIYRDMHDDLGSKLLSIIYRSEDGDTRQLASSALDDMRAIVADDGEEASESEMVGAWHRECRGRCEEAGVNLHWEVSGPIRCSHRENYHLTRALRELVTNALKHAKATDLFVEVVQQNERLFVQVRDNGSGFDNSNLRKGTGMRGIEKRMRELGGRVEWSATASGTQVKLEILP
ncbi:MAG: ATP-binding protein [Pseudomonadota bacterium]